MIQSASTRIAGGLFALLVGVGAVTLSAGPVAASAPAQSMSAEAKAWANRLPDAALLQTTALGGGLTRKRFGLDKAKIKELRGSWKADAHEKAKIDQHIDRMMRQGKNVASSAVDVVAFEVPGVTPFYLVQNKTDELSNFVAFVTGKEGEAGHQLDFGMESADLDELPAAGASAGFDAATGQGSVTNRTRGGRTVYFNPAYNSVNNADHWVTQNYEKWQSTASGQQRFWGYNSYATFDAAEDAESLWIAQLYDATIRARPYKGYESRVTSGPYDYDPKPQEVCQSSATLNINVSSYGSLSIPFMNCYSGQEIYPNSTQHSMGTAVYGFTTAQRYLDFGFEFQASNTTITPIFSDYIWMTVVECPWNIWNTCSGQSQSPTSYKWTDGGW